MRLLQKVEKLTQTRLVVVIFTFISCAIFALAINLIWPSSDDGEPIMNPQFPSLMDLYPQALAQAHSWHSDAYMIWADVSFRHADVVAAFAFDMLSDPKQGLLVYFRQIDGGYEIKLNEVDASARSENRPPINPDSWSVDSVEVAQTVFEERGSEFLRNHPEVDQALLQLRRISGASAENTGIEQDSIVWIMSYYKLRGVELRVFIDPITGEIIGEEFFEAGNFDPLDDSGLEVDTF